MDVRLTEAGRAYAVQMAAQGSIVAAVALDGDRVQSQLGWPAAHEASAIEACNEIGAAAAQERLLG